MELTATVPVVKVDASNSSVSTARQPLTLIPYYAWANRGRGEMTVWFPAKVTGIDLIAQPSAAETAQK